MPEAVYISLRDQYLRRLETVYEQVASPIQAPGKDTYGDVDILASAPQSDDSVKALEELLDATTSISSRNSVTRSFAVPYPGSSEDYVQVDVHVCPPETFQWELFQQSHGDMWNLIGTSLRPFGLTANNVGFHLRIEEIEEIDRRRSMLFLTSDPSRVLTFIGLDESQYWRSFKTTDDLYNYVTTFRFFLPERYEREILKSSDRKRSAQRIVFRTFIDEWLPARRSQFSQRWTGPELREAVMLEACKEFGVAERYAIMLREWSEERKELLAKQNTNEWRRAASLARVEEMRLEIEYAEEWIRHLNNRSDVIQSLQAESRRSFRHRLDWHRPLNSHKSSVANNNNGRLCV
ncbi:MAG: hypothetical protein MMC33_007557 [Icmadophila ericetorum]|nr:hypothetical protein [Icmadophila ericetorum]